MAGPHFDTKNFGVKPDVAEKTVAIYTNPGFYGTDDRNRAQVNILVNPDQFQQPGYHRGLSDKLIGLMPALDDAINLVDLPANMYNHIFALPLVGAMCAKTPCYANGKSHIDLNVIYNDDIPAGTYHLTLTKCYPFCGCTEDDSKVKVDQTKVKVDQPKVTKVQAKL